MTRYLAPVLLALLLAGALLGCGSDDEPSSDEDPPTDTADTEPAEGDDDADPPPDEGSDDDAVADPDDDPDDGPDEPADEGDADEGEAAGRHLVGSVEIDEERVSDDNVYVTVTGLTAEPNAVYVDIIAFNGWDHDAHLAWGSQSVYLQVDDTRLTFRPPEDNDLLEVPSGGELEGRLAFLGRIPAATESVTLRLNWGDQEPLGLGPGIPSFEFTDLPVPAGS